MQPCVVKFGSFEPVLKALEKAKKDGKARFVGVSTHRNELEVAQAAIDSKFYDRLMLPYHHKQQNYLEFRETIAKAAPSGPGNCGHEGHGGNRRHCRHPQAGKRPGGFEMGSSGSPTFIPRFLESTSFDEMNIDLSVMEDLPFSDAEKGYPESRIRFSHPLLPGVWPLR